MARLVRAIWHGTVVVQMARTRRAMTLIGQVHRSIVKTVGLTHPSSQTAELISERVVLRHESVVRRDMRRDLPGTLSGFRLGIVR